MVALTLEHLLAQLSDHPMEPVTAALSAQAQHGGVLRLSAAEARLARA